MLNVYFLLTVAVACSDEPSKPIVFSDVTVVDVESGWLIPNRSVVIDGTKITAVASTNDFQVPDGAIVIPASGEVSHPWSVEHARSH